MRLTSDTLVFREQHWTTATDGTGFVLGPASDTTVIGSTGRRAFLTALAARVHIQGTQAAPNPPSRQTLLGRELDRADPRWQRLRLFVFLRGEGDVEHTALAGVDPTTGRIAALYLN